MLAPEDPRHAARRRATQWPEAALELRLNRAVNARAIPPENAPSGRGELSLEKSPNWSSLSDAMNGRRDDRRAVGRRTSCELSADGRLGRFRFRLSGEGPRRQAPRLTAGRISQTPAPGLPIARPHCGGPSLTLPFCQPPSLMRRVGRVPLLALRAPHFSARLAGRQFRQDRWNRANPHIRPIPCACRQRMISSNFCSGVSRICAPC